MSDKGRKFEGTELDDNEVGTEKNDTFKGKGGNDTFRGLGGNDTLQGGNDYDTLYGGAGNDFIGGWKGNDKIYGGAGDDTLRGGMGKDIFFYEDRDFGHDVIKDFQIGKDKLDFTGSNLSLIDLKILENDAGDVVITDHRTGSSITLEKVSQSELLINISESIIGLANVSGFSTIFGSTDDDNDLAGTAGDDLIFGLTGNDTISGLAGNDDLYGGRGDDTLFGGEGRDLIFGGAGNDRISGGTGDDWLNGGSGADIFLYDKPIFGQDVIQDFEDGMDKLDLTGSGRSLAELQIIENDAGDVVVTDIRTGSSITLEGVSQSDLLDNISENIVGLESLHSFTSIFGSAGDDDRPGTGGNDLIFGLAGNDKVSGLAGDDRIYGGRGNDTLSGGDGGDSLYGGAGDDRLSGGTGNDWLIGGRGADTFAYGSTMFGDDFIADFENGDLLDFSGSGLSLADLTVEEASGHTTVTVEGKGTIKLLNTSKATVLEHLNGLTIYGTEGDDVLTGTDRDDEIVGLGGNDTLSGGTGADTFRYDSPWFGEDTITDFSIAEDKLDFTGSGLSLAQLDFVEEDGNTIVKVVDTSSKITLKGVTGVTGVTELSDSELPPWIGGLVPSPVDKNVIRGTEAGERHTGTEDIDCIFGEGGDDWISGKGGDDDLYGGAGRDTFAYGSATFGNDVIKDFEAGEDGDVLDFTGAGLDYDDLAVAIGDDKNVTVTVKETGSSITLEGIGAMKTIAIKGVYSPDGVGLGDGYYVTVGTDAGETMTGDDGVDVFLAHGGDDILYGQEGNDDLHGGGGNDTIYGGIGIDKLWGGEGNDDLYGGSDGEGGARGNETLYGGIGNDNLYGGAGSDYLTGGAGDDNMTGGDGADLFQYGAGEFGNDTIHDFKDGTDKVQFTSKGDLTFDDLKIENKNGHAVVTVKDDADRGSITFLKVSAADLTSEDFLFA